MCCTSVQLPGTPLAQARSTHPPNRPGPQYVLQISNNVTLSHNSAEYSGGVLYVGGALYDGLQLQVRRQGSWHPGRAPRLYAKPRVPLRQTACNGVQHMACSHMQHMARPSSCSLYIRRYLLPKAYIS